MKYSGWAAPEIQATPAEQIGTCPTLLAEVA